jgi:large-conductance mechanosensitive channel
VNKFANLRKKNQPEEVAEEIALLREIRDSLRERGVPAQRG